LFAKKPKSSSPSVRPSVRVSLSRKHRDQQQQQQQQQQGSKKHAAKSSTTAAAASNEDKAKSLGMAPNKRKRNRADPQKKRHQEDSGTRKGRPDFNNVYLISWNV
jgi:phage protein D